MVSTSRGYRPAATVMQDSQRRGGDYRRKDKMEGRAFAAVGPPGGLGLRGLAEVAVVQAADFRKLHDWPAARSSMGLSSGGSLSSARCVRA
jgi:hypothetical protein